MKPKFITSILLFISAYSPLLVIIAVKDFDFIDKFWFNHPSVIYCLLAITIISVVVLFAIFNKIDRGSMLVVVISVKHRSNDLINYTIPYMVAFFGADLNKWNDIISIFIFLSLMLLLTITTKSIFINPILAVFGYGFYDIEYKYAQKTKSVAVISKLELHPGDKYYVQSLTRFMYFITEGENDERDS